jgi:hypothetical protein
MKNKNMCTLEELNLQAAMLKGKGDLEGVIRVAEANGLTVRTAERYLMDEEPALTTQKELAIGRLLLESVDLDLRQSVVLTMIQDIPEWAAREAIKEYYLEKTSTNLAIANTYVDFQDLQKGESHEQTSE